MPLALLFHYLMLNMSRMLIQKKKLLPPGDNPTAVNKYYYYYYYYYYPQELATYLLSYFMGCVALVRCVLVLRCGLAVVVWYPYAG